MATLDLSGAGSGFDMRSADPGVFGSHHSDGTPTSWSYLTPKGLVVRLIGTGLTYDLAGRPTGGTVSSITIDANGDGYPELKITGISVAATTLDDGTASFWRFLEGADVILGPERALGGADAIFTMVGDGIAARDGTTGGRDVIHAGDRIGSSVGDVSKVGLGARPTATYRGGNDEILGLVTEKVQYMYGDAATVYTGSRLTGGDDSILIQSYALDSAVAGDAAETFDIGKGGVATVVGGNDYIAAGRHFAGILAGDLYHQGANSHLRGGADTINGGDVEASMAGDVYQIGDGYRGVTAAEVIGGNDTINGGARSDVIAGDVYRIRSAPVGSKVVGGDDAIGGGGGDDVISGDVYSSYPGFHAITGGRDAIRGGAGNDRIYGDSTDNNQNAVGVGGDDRLYGEDGNDRLFGQGGDDTVDGGAGADEVSGGDGDDWLSGGAGSDRLDGWKGDDQLDGGADADVMGGGAGDDAYFVNSSGDRVQEAAGDGVDTVWSSLAGCALAANVENLHYNGPGSFVGVGNGLGNTISGLSGNDRLDGGAGDDLLVGRAGADALVGGAGIDTASYAGASEGVDARLLGGGYAGEALGDSFSGIERLVGSAYGDVLSGSETANAIAGGDGSDMIVGMDGGDLLRGGRGADVLVGGRGADLFDVDAVGDSAPGARDRIAADIQFGLVFEGAGVAGGDRIDLSGIDANARVAGNQAFGFGGTGIGRVSLASSGSDTLVRCNTDADAAFEIEIVVEDGGVLASAYRAVDFVL